MRPVVRGWLGRYGGVGYGVDACEPGPASRLADRTQLHEMQGCGGEYDRYAAVEQLYSGVYSPLASGAGIVEPRLEEGLELRGFTLL